MRVPTKIQLQAPPPWQWELRLPGIPFEVHVCNNGRWVITSGRDSVAYGSEGNRDDAAQRAGDTLLDWATGIRVLASTVAAKELIELAEKPEPTKEQSKPFTHPMAAKEVTPEKAQSKGTKK